MIEHIMIFITGALFGSALTYMKNIKDLEQIQKQFKELETKYKEVYK